MEIDISKPKLLEMKIVLPIGKVKVNFEYEHEFKPCEHCFKQGHDKDSCFAFKKKQSEGKGSKMGAPKHGRSKSAYGRNNWNRSKSRLPSTSQQASALKPSENLETPHLPQNASSSKYTRDIDVSIFTNEIPENEMGTMNEEGTDGDCEKGLNKNDIALDEVKTNEGRTQEPPHLDKGKQPRACDIPSLGDGPSAATMPVVTQPTNADRKAKKKNKKKNKKKENEKSGINENMKTLFGDLEDEGSCDMEYEDGNTSKKKVRYSGMGKRDGTPKVFPTPNDCCILEYLGVPPTPKTKECLHSSSNQKD